MCNASTARAAHNTLFYAEIPVCLIFVSLQILVTSVGVLGRCCLMFGFLTLFIGAAREDSGSLCYSGRLKSKNLFGPEGDPGKRSGLTQKFRTLGNL